MTTTTNNKTIDEQLTFDDQVIEKIAGITASKFLESFPWMEICLVN